MKLVSIDNRLSLSGQIDELDLQALKKENVEVVVCNRPDNEAGDQLSYLKIESIAQSLGIDTISIPFRSGEIGSDEIERFREVYESGKRLHSYCRTGNRSFCLYAVMRASAGASKALLLAQAQEVGFDISELIEPYYFQNESGSTQQIKTKQLRSAGTPYYDVAIVGAGTGGIAIAASLLKRNTKLRLVLIDPSNNHFYQPGWTMVGGGVFSKQSTCRETRDIIPRNASWIKQPVTKFAPDKNEIELGDESLIRYEQLVIAAGLTLNWAGVKGLQESLGEHGITSNYAFNMAPYTWQLVQGLKKGRAIFTQPPMPIKCAGAPQKALYLSCDHWLKAGVLSDIDVSFVNAGDVLFGVNDYVPALQSYIDKYGVTVAYASNLIEVKAKKRQALFQESKDGVETQIVTREFDLLHVCPPQKAPEFISQSVLADDRGWLDVDIHTLRHKKFSNVWGLGDVTNTPNAKTMAAVRKQVPVVAENLLAVMQKGEPLVGYDGYGSCPLTVENGKIVLAEFGYEGKLLPSFPPWLINGKKPSTMAWFLKKNILPGFYWHGMLKGHEWLARPKALDKFKE